MSQLLRTASALLLAIPVAAWAPAEARADDQPTGPSGSPEEITVFGEHRVTVPLLTQPTVDTPQTITIIPKEIIQLQGLTDLRDVLRNDPSVSIHADEDSAQGTNVYIRGFSARFDTYIDGMLDLGSYYRDPFYLEEVDVLTGPSSVLFGRGSTGGAIQQVSKTPKADWFADADVTFGTDQMKRLTADVNLPIEDGIALRLNVMGQQSDIAGRDLVGYERFGVAPSLVIGLNTPTQLLISFMHQSEWDTPDYGVPWIDIGSRANVSYPADVPSHNFYGFSSDYVRSTADITTVTFNHEFNDDLKFRDQFRYATYQRNYRAVAPAISALIAPSTPLSSVSVSRVVRGGFSTETFLDDQIDATAQFETFGVSHTVVFGGEFGEQTSDPTVLKYSGVPNANLIAPNPYQPFSGTATPSKVASFTADTQALYATDTLVFDKRWELTAAVRLDRFDASYFSPIPSPASFNHVDLRPSWRGALTFKATDDLSLYATYGTSFDPSGEGLSLSASTADLSPERTRTIEAGVKWDFEDRLLLSAALFRTLQVNLRETSPVDPTVTILAGNARAEGVELQAQGHVTPEWLVLAGYTYLNASIISSPDADKGSPIQSAPRHSVKAWSAYSLPDGFTIGGGIDYQSSRAPGSFLDGNGLLQRAPGYVTVSAMAKYDITSKMSLQLNVDNLLDRKYYDGLDDNHVNIGAGRSAHLTFSIRD